MSKPVFVYTIYIASTPEKVFKALIDTNATAKFWFGNAVKCDWKIGAPVEFHREGKLIVQGKVLEYDPPRRLSYTFHSMHEPFYGAEQPSPAVIDLEKHKDQLKLHVTQDEFVEGSKVFDAISRGGPLVLSSLKSSLEANRVLYAPWYDKEPAAAS